jgi:probable FeS assembly SUF system protein SufT
MRFDEVITLRRDCESVVIPYGTPMPLKAGTNVLLMQALGGSFTVQTPEGYMVRIADADADALGKEAPRRPPAEAAEPGPKDAASLEEAVWDQLRTCYDPEIPANIVDLGLVYACRVTPLEEGDHAVEITMTLTAPGCGMGDIIKADVERKVAALPGVGRAHVEMVIDPPWNPEMMSEAARLQLGML